MLNVLHRDRLAPRIHDGAFSGMDVTARHPRTGELLSTEEVHGADPCRRRRTPARPSTGADVRGAGYTLRVTAAPVAHRQLLACCQALDGVGAIPAQRKARREYANRVSALIE